MKLAKQTQSDTQSTATIAEKVKKPGQQYDYGLGHFIKFKQRYVRPNDKEKNHSFELGYN